MGDMRAGVSSGVGGKAAEVVDMGGGRDGWGLGGAIGKVNESLLVVLEAEEADLDDRFSMNSSVCDWGGVVMSSWGIRRVLVSSGLPERFA